ncbi:MAG: sulfatase-like hydrolase/transferase, partial [Draconibacterium sp.]|nr:sulfatase-like hydrolase/transferase [Draconibacterium sp.]
MISRVVSLLFVTFLFFSCSVQNNKELPLPNILWITTEDISPQLGCYGFEHVNTPVLDALAAKGVMYTNAIA